MPLDAIKQLVHEDWAAVNQLIAQHVDSEITLIKQLGQYIIYSGGKRLRPLLVLLGARVFNYQGNDHIHLAALVEFIHTATLLHDDVVDASGLRRGNETANAIWGNEASVLVGDFLFSRSFQMMVDVGNLKIMGILAKVTNTIAKGEVMQLMNCHNPDTSESHYMQVIEAKTAALFAAATEIGALLSDQPTAIQQAMHAYGNHLGTAFQLVDDALDYSGKREEMGKNIGDDLAEGKPTLPLIYSLRAGSAAQKNIIETAIAEGGLSQLAAIQETIASTGAIEYTYAAAEKQVELAIGALAKVPDSPYRDALLAMAEFAISRTH